MRKALNLHRKIGKCEKPLLDFSITQLEALPFQFGNLNDFFVLHFKHKFNIAMRKMFFTGLALCIIGFAMTANAAVFNYADEKYRFTWTDSAGVEHSNLLTDKATWHSLPRCMLLPRYRARFTATKSTKPVKSTTTIMHLKPNTSHRQPRQNIWTG